MKYTNLLQCARLIAVLCLIGAGWRSQAQVSQQSVRPPNFPDPVFNCYPVRAATARQTGSGARNFITTYNPNGLDITPRGDLRVLIVYAGFTNDINLGAPGYSTGAWPQIDPNNSNVPAGTTFPVNAGGGFYTNSTQFSTSATDQTLSNFYYQMSQFSGNPLRMYATIFPKRFNVTATNALNYGNNSSGGFFTYTQQVMSLLQNDPDTKTYDFSQVDKRGANPRFTYDNSPLAPDQRVDYVIIVWRNAGKPYNTTTPVYAGGGGWASVPPCTISTNYGTYTIDTGFTHTLDMSGVNPGVFTHEFAHGFFACPHYFGANSVVGDHFNSTNGPGMMGYFRTYFCANAWERWFNGWAALTASGAATDIQDANSLNATGVYTLRDYISTGDMMRIRLPGTSGQYLWLENHTGINANTNSNNVFDHQYGLVYDGQPTPQLFRPAPTGILAMIEDVNNNLSNPFPDPQYVSNYTTGVNGLKVLSAQGNFDYGHSAMTNPYNNHFFGNPLYSFTKLAANPFAGESEISQHRFDVNGDSTIFWLSDDGNQGSPKNEQELSFVDSALPQGQFEDGLLGPDVTFNTVGQKMGLASNPTIGEHPHYSSYLTFGALTPTTLHGLSVELIGKNAKTGAITIRVRFDDVEVDHDRRWCGNLVMTDAVPGPAADVRVTGSFTAATTLTINKSGTANRDTPVPGTANDFINPTQVVCATGTTLVADAGPADAGATVSVEDLRTSFYVVGKVQVNRGCQFVVKAGALLVLSNGSTFELNRGSLVVEPGGTLLINNGATIVVKGTGSIDIQDGAYLCVGAGAVWQTARTFILAVSQQVHIGINPAFSFFNPPTCSTQLAFCGVLTGGNPNLTTACPDNEALAFDGIDDVVTIPSYASSPLHALDETFTIEAYLRADAPANPLGTYGSGIFSHQQIQGSDRDGIGLYLLDGHFLALQVGGITYADVNDPTTDLDAAGGSGCHEVAVTRDAGGRISFYVDGNLSTYQPTSGRSGASSADVYLGRGADTNEYFTGHIGEVRVWDIDRNAADIATDLSVRYTSAQPHLVAYYDMRDPQGSQVVADQSMSGYQSDGYRGTSTNADGQDPDWVAVANVTCTVNGIFRSAAANAQPATSSSIISSYLVTPNPANDQARLSLHLRQATTVTVSVRDQAGAIRLRPRSYQLEAGDQLLNLPLQEVPEGVYLLVVESGDGRKVIRLQVNH